MEFVERIFPNGFRKGATGNATPRARFEAIAIGCDLALRDRPELVERSADELDVAPWIEGQEFIDVTGSDGANARARLEGRLNFVRSRLVEAS